MEEKEETKKLLDYYRNFLSEKIGKENPAVPLVNDEGKLIFDDQRWVLMNVKYFPGYTIKSIQEIVGPIAKEFFYWFGYAYGIQSAEEYLKAGIPKEYILPFAFAIRALYAGWGVAKIYEVDYEKPYLKMTVFNNFETESAKYAGLEPDFKLSAGYVAGLFSKLTGKKIRASEKLSEDGHFIAEFFAKD